MNSHAFELRDSIGGLAATIQKTCYASALGWPRQVQRPVMHQPSAGQEKSFPASARGWPRKIQSLVMPLPWGLPTQHYIFLCLRPRMAEKSTTSCYASALGRPRKRSNLVLPPPSAGQEHYKNFLFLRCRLAKNTWNLFCLRTRLAKKVNSCSASFFSG